MPAGTQDTEERKRYTINWESKMYFLHTKPMNFGLHTSSFIRLQQPAAEAYISIESIACS